MNKLLAILYILANVADYGFTVYGVSVTSFEKEVNKIAQDILMNHGISGLFVYKFGGVVFVLLILTVLIRVNWDKPWVKHMVPVLLLLGIAISLIGAWGWLPTLSM